VHDVLSLSLVAERDVDGIVQMPSTFSFS